ncbi:hypothetical protein AURANDRAFT_72554 [Aureococcus anophagefferens]|uniref:MutL C-terminal dimerisation domain-containing protein n=1 Tax=Aureococcus anophagefferens TaxID=44056 RepID=F0YKV0_AURAN|nr:hypothetical protein AURANDRAFT_72554 [Aureococcus anophagefferens]EGB04191.1 hypothetical protein AURANDRAFT_72554 [Aureococcus anophagefferens]|eukprot:XP_009041044.1 hypothetical protein AURANDRAFT_72554 [Aureococcus anophagefferens]
MLTNIAKIDTASARKLSSGQVVVDLAGAVKELLENALDAGATSIELRINDDGGGAEIECADNGHGIAHRVESISELRQRSQVKICIAPRDFALVAARSATSKLVNFEELRTVQSFGFRGEALASLRELAGEVLVVTRTSADAVGARLSFQRDGILKSSTPHARSVGTTVTVRGLFDCAPVRRADLARRWKWHVSRALRTVQAHALVAVGCRLRLTLVSGGGATRRTAIAVQAPRSLRESASALFGHAFARSLEEVSFDLRGGEDCSLAVIGLMSRAGGFDAPGPRGGGGDRQFLFVNGRPIDAPRVSRCIGDVWRSVEGDRRGRPAFVLDIRVPPSAVDVNVSPDKRDVVLDDETGRGAVPLPATSNLLVAALRIALHDLWEPSRGSFAGGRSLAPHVAPSTTPDTEAPCSLVLPIAVPSCVTSTATATNAPAREAMLVVPPTLRPTQRNSDTIAVAQVIALSPWQAARAHIDWNCAVAPARLHASSVFGTLAVQSRCGHGHRTVQIDRRPGGNVPTAALAKADFSAMEALGQFNLGFLVCRLGDHLFLVDQHAADEKFRYEALWRDTRVDTQPLLAPLSLDLGATEELALLERRCTVERVGFRLAVNDLAPPGRRVAVISASALSVLFCGSVRLPSPNQITLVSGSGL